jgi:hypothetical protein
MGRAILPFRDADCGREIAAGAVARDADARRIDAEPAMVGMHPGQRRARVVEGGGKRMFRRQAIADIDDHAARGIGELAAERLVDLERADGPAAAMEIDDRGRDVAGAAFRADDVNGGAIVVFRRDPENRVHLFQRRQQRTAALFILTADLFEVTGRSRAVAAEQRDHAQCRRRGRVGAADKPQNLGGRERRYRPGAFGLQSHGVAPFPINVY